MSTPNSCPRCGEVVFDEKGEQAPRVAIQLALDELIDLAIQTSCPSTSHRLCCAIGLIDPDLELRTRYLAAEARGEPVSPAK